MRAGAGMGSWGSDASRGYAAALDRIEDAGDRPRPVIGVVGPEDGDGVSDETRRAIDAAADAVRSLGYETRLVALPHPAQAARAVMALIYAEASSYHLPWLRERPEGYAAATRERLELGTLLPATVYLRAARARAVVVAAYRELFRTIDVLLLPVSAKPSYLIDPAAHPAGADAVDPEAGDRILAGLRFSSPFNLTGQPGISVPGGATAAGLPIGIQLVGRPWAEAGLLRLAGQVETAMAGALPPRARNRFVV